MTLLSSRELSYTIYVLRSAGLVFAWIAIVNSLVLILKHVRENRHAALRAYTIRILLMVPVYSVAACAVLWGSGVIPIIRQVLGFVRELYESVVIFSFLQFVMECTSGPDAFADRFSKMDCGRPAEGPRWSSALAEVGGQPEEEIARESTGGKCRRPAAEQEAAGPGTPAAEARQVSGGSRGPRELVHLPLFSRCLPPWRSARQMLRFCVRGTLAYVAVGGTLAILGLFLLLVEAVAGRSRATGQVVRVIWEFGTIGLSLSQALAIVSLAELAVNLKEELAPLRPYGKFLSVKMVVFFTFWQGMLLSSLARAGAFGFLARGQGEAALVREVINNFLICVEMMVASWYHYRVFPPHDYLMVLAQLRYSGTDVDSPASLGRPIRTSDVVDIRDIWLTARQIHRSRSASEVGEPSSS